jgi:hypothetical protein
LCAVTGDILTTDGPFVEVLAAATWAALQVITPPDARGYSTHSGYRALAQHA